jgi:hypothetical protein
MEYPPDHPPLELKVFHSGFRLNILCRGNWGDDLRSANPETAAIELC